MLLSDTAIGIAGSDRAVLSGSTGARSEHASMADNQGRFDRLHVNANASRMRSLVRDEQTSRHTSILMW